MDKKKIAEIIESYAPLNLAEDWDCSGWLVNTKENEQVQKIMICLTVTDGVIMQARENNCDIVISHHPLFFIPFEYKDINIYCAHTNLDKAFGGTTDALIDNLGLPKGYVVGDFLRIVEHKISTDNFSKKLRKISDNVRIVNNKSVTEIEKIAFCAGSGAEFIQEAFENGADALVTGDVKFHTAIESPIVLFDIGHFESEIPVLNVFLKLLKNTVPLMFASEKSPFKSF